MAQPPESIILIDSGGFVREYDLQDVIRRRASGQTWAEIGSAYGRSKNSAASWFHARKNAVPRPAAAPRTAPPPPPSSLDEAVPGVDDGNAPPSPPQDSADPFEETVRPAPTPAAESSSEPSSDASGPVASRLGEDAARAYLPLLFGSMDALAGAGAVWLVRRKLGERATTEIMLQARTLATLHEAEKMALESALVNRLAAIELTPDEALLYTVVAIYAAKALAVASLDVDDRRSEPLTLQVA